MEHQDWKDVVIRGGGDKANHSTKKKTGIQKKYHGGTNKSRDQQSHKLDENEIKAPKKMRSGLGTEISKARLAKDWKQKDLAHRMNVLVYVIQKYEQGNAIPNGQFLNKMGRVLGCRLSNKDPKKKKSPHK